MTGFLRPRLLEGLTLPRPHQQRSRDKRARLTDAALALFGERGYAAVSMTEIAQRAALPTGTVYQHFGSKQLLLLSLMDDCLQHLSTVNVPPAPTTRREDVVQQLVGGALVNDRGRFRVVRAWLEAILGDSVLAEHDRAIHDWTRDRITTALDVLRKLRGFRRDVQVGSVAVLLDQWCWALMADATQLPGLERELRIATTCQMINHALFQDDAPRRSTRPRRRSRP